MSDRNLKGNLIFRTLSPEDAERGATTALGEIARSDFPQWLIDDTLTNVYAAVHSRSQTGMLPDPTLDYEVKGLVHAAMGGNRHIRDVERLFNRYVVCLVQTDTLQKGDL